MMYLTVGLSSLYKAVAAPPFLLIDVLIKSLLFLICAALLLVFLRRTAAATRHLAAVLVMLGLVSLPVLSYALPAWRLAVFPPSAPSPDGGDPATGIVSKSRVDLPSAPRRSAPSESGEPLEQPDSSSSPVPVRPARLDQQTTSDWAYWVGVIWLVGASGVLSRWGVGILAARRLIGCGRPVRGNRLESFQAVKTQLGMHRGVRLVETSRIRVPVVTGIFSPTVLIPARGDCSPQQFRLVLAHELAHLKRWDCATDLLMQLGCAAYWYNPLVWLLASRARLDRERACDDLVLNLGTRPSDYASTLLHFACPQGRGLLPRAVLGMASPSSLERRLVMILNSKSNRRPVGRWTLLAGVVLLLVAVVPLATVRPTARAADPSEEPAREGAANLLQAIEIDESDVLRQGESAELLELKPIQSLIIATSPEQRSTTGRAEQGGTQQAPAGPRRAAAQGGELRFAPVQERTVWDDAPAGEGFLIDLETGTVANAPEDVWENPSEQKKFLKEHGIDAMYEAADATGKSLIGLEMVVMPVGEWAWTNEEPGRLAGLLTGLKSFGQAGTPALMSGQGDLPATYVFVTREGGEGVLQILDFIDQGRGKAVKIQYKLVANE